MKNYDYWESFVNTGSIDDYLHYIACTREEIADEPISDNDNLLHGMEREGEFIAGINYRDGNGSVGHAGW